MRKLGDFTDIDDRQLVADAVALAERENTLAASTLAALAEIDRRGLAHQLGASSIARWWARGTRVTDGHAARQLEHAHWLTAFPDVQQALYDAEIHHAHTVAIHDGLDAVTAADHLTTDRQTAVVADLLDVARTGTTHTITRRATTLALAAAHDAHARAEQARADAESVLTDESLQPFDTDVAPNPTPAEPNPTSEPTPPPVPPSENAALNRLTITALPNGRNHIDGNFDTLTTHHLRAALNEHSAPVPGPDGQRDPRPAAQRTADALTVLLHRNFAGTGRPTFAGTLDLTALAQRSAEPKPAAPPASPAPPDNPVPPGDRTSGDWPFHLTWSGPISHALALLVACDAQLNPTIVDGAGVPLAMGRTVRTVTADQRTAVTVRDRSCIMCGRPPQWCQVHHLTHWAHGGTTDLDNLALLCGECHRHVHQYGYDIVLGDDRHPRIIPPTTHDPRRQPHETHHRQQRRRRAA